MIWLQHFLYYQCNSIQMKYITIIFNKISALSSMKLKRVYVYFKIMLNTYEILTYYPIYRIVKYIPIPPPPLKTTLTLNSQLFFSFLFRFSHVANTKCNISDFTWNILYSMFINSSLLFSSFYKTINTSLAMQLSTKDLLPISCLYTIFLFFLLFFPINFESFSLQYNY